VRVQRRFVNSEKPPITVADVEELMRDILFVDHRVTLRDKGQVDVLYVARTGQRFRTTVALQGEGPAVLMRPVPENPPELKDLDLPPQISTFTQYRSGLVMVTGFFGSGKSSTLAALVNHLNHESGRHVITVEDPIEFVHPIGTALLHQREVGVHVKTAAEGVDQAAGVGAEVIAVSDLADPATLEAALNAVESGMLVIAAMESSSVVGLFSDMLGLVAAEARPRLRTRLAVGLRAVVAQTLVPRVHGKGRVPLVEVLINNAAVRTAIRAGQFQDLNGIMQRNRGLGMQNADGALRSLRSRHLVGHEEVVQHTAVPDLPRS
jgi:twitching motility protein PilT